ncbi:MAG: hypothetical protein IJ064_01000 [Bacteroidaceae bacterium]|nr:hypothetical protein [Bacteroidaceae bacterium]
MMHIRRLLGLLAALLAVAVAVAQSNGSNSSYSRFGLGLLTDRSQGLNLGMAGVAQGLRSPMHANTQNPASYSAIDSLTFIFDAGMSLQRGHMASGGKGVNAFNASLDYVTAGMRLSRGLGLSFGFIPYSSIGYNFDVTGQVGSSYTSTQAITTRTTYYGNGGLHELYMGVGWRPVADLSIGANIGYLWGEYDHSLAQRFYEGGTVSSNYSALNEVWGGDLRTYKLDIGVQYPVRLNQKNQLGLGATMSLGHTIGSNISLMRYTSKGDTITRQKSKAFDIPHTIAVGASWQHDERLTLAADYTLEHWSGCRVPVSQTTPTTTDIFIATNQYSNKHRVALGADYIHKTQGRKYAERIHYRIGASYTTPYVKVNGANGPYEYALTAGATLPLNTGSRSVINVAVEWKRRVPNVSQQISENYLMLHMGITFNETWFMKWKFQ